MFGLMQTVKDCVSISLVKGGVDVWASYGFLLGSWIAYSIVSRLYARFKSPN